MGCSPKVSNKNLAYGYKKDVLFLHPDYSTFHLNDSSSRLYFKINSSELLYIKKEENQNFAANIKVSVRLFSSYESKTVIDSFSIKLSDEGAQNSSADIISYLDFKLKTGSNYLAEVSFTDLLRGQTRKDYIQIKKTDKSGRQNYIITNPDLGTPVFKNYIHLGDKIRISHNDSVNSNLFVRFYKRSFSLPAPPFSEVVSRPFGFKADSIFKYNVKDTFTIINTGFYHFQIDTTQKEGITLFHFNDEYPELKNVEQLIPPLRYITSKTEYEAIATSTNKKTALDNFWLDNAGNASRAREVLKFYYNRVQDANNFFSSYVEGWKTDRGLIYIIYGPPNAVYKLTDGEVWTYGEENNIKSLNFTFSKVVNPFTDNDYSLIRSPAYKDSWYVAVDTWRQGRVFTEK